MGNRTGTGMGVGAGAGNGNGKFASLLHSKNKRVISIWIQVISVARFHVLQTAMTYKELS